jgi:hypothetical protein
VEAGTKMLWVYVEDFSCPRVNSLIKYWRKSVLQDGTKIPSSFFVGLCDLFLVSGTEIKEV